MTDNGQANDDVERIVITNTTTLHLPVELDGNGPDMFTLIAKIVEFTEDGVAHKHHVLYMRCNDCDWGYNSHDTFVRLGDVLNIGHRAKYHSEHCPHTGRTLDLDSPEIGR